MKADRTAIQAGALAATDAVALWRLWPDLAALRRDLAGPQAWIDRVGADQAAFTLAAVALWLVGLWLAAGLAAALLGRLPGTLGLVGRRLARVALPRALYRAAAGAAGLGVLLAPVAASAHATSHAGGQSVPGPSIPTPSWPTDSAPPVPQLPAPHLPVPELPASTQSGPARTGPATSGPDLGRAGPAEVIVRPGDSLWQIAAAQLPGRASDARIAAAWPRWWAANRAVIGADPNHLTPGQVLHAPAERHTS